MWSLGFVSLWQYISHEDRLFSIGLELLSLIVLAPLTARYVAWQNDSKWKQLRSELVHRVLDEIVVVRASIEYLADNLPGKTKFADALQKSLTRIEREMATEGWSHGIEPGVVFEARNEASYEVILLESPATVSKSCLVACGSVPASIGDAARRLEAFVTNYSFCLSPDMIQAISAALSIPVAAPRYKREVSDTIWQGNTRLAHLWHSGAKVLAEPFALYAEDAKIALETWASKIEHPASERVGEAIKFVPILKFTAVADALTSLAAHNTGRKDRKEIERKLNFIANGNVPMAEIERKVDDFVAFVSEDAEVGEVYRLHEERAMALVAQRSIRS
jgi:hypothetical protein